MNFRIDVVPFVVPFQGLQVNATFFDGCKAARRIKTVVPKQSHAAQLYQKVVDGPGDDKRERGATTVHQQTALGSFFPRSVGLFVYVTDPLTQFLQDFRNSITHYAIPHIGLEQRVGSTHSEPEPIKLFIELDHLEARFNWSSPGRQFIETNRPKMRMLKLADDHGLKSKSFYDGLMHTFQKHLGRELNEVRSLMQESNNLWTKMVEDMTKPPNPK